MPLSRKTLRGKSSPKPELYSPFNLEMGERAEETNQNVKGDEGSAVQCRGEFGSKAKASPSCVGFAHGGTLSLNPISNYNFVLGRMTSLF